MVNDMSHRRNSFGEARAKSSVIVGVFHNTRHKKQATRAHMDRESPSARTLCLERHGKLQGREDLWLPSRLWCQRSVT